MESDRRTGTWTSSEEGIGCVNLERFSSPYSIFKPRRGAHGIVDGGMVPERRRKVNMDGSASCCRPVGLIGEPLLWTHERKYECSTFARIHSAKIAVPTTMTSPHFLDVDDG